MSYSVSPLDEEDDQESDLSDLDIGDNDLEDNDLDEVRPSYSDSPLDEYITRRVTSLTLTLGQ